MKRFVSIFAYRPIAGLMLFLSFCLLGTVALFKLPMGLMPNVNSPGITVITGYPGVAAEKMDELLTVPLERRLSDVQGINQIISVSKDGESRVNLLFDHNTDIKSAILEANERIHLIRGQFPRDVQEPYIIRYDPGDKPIYIISFSSAQHDLKRLREIVDQLIKPRYEQIDGASEVMVGGGFEREIHITVDPSSLAARGLGPGAAAGWASQNNVFTPGGRLRSGEDTDERRVYTDAKLRALSDLRLLGAERLRLIDMGAAVIRDHYRDRTSIARMDGEDRVTIYVKKAGNADTPAVTDAALLVTKALKREFPRIKAEVIYNEGKHIRKAVSRVASACFYGMILAALVFYLFLRRASITLAAGLTIPGSMLTTFLLMYFSDIKLGIMSLAGLALGAGMILDNSIVVSEAVTRAAADYAGSFTRAIIRGTAGVASEIIAATATTVVVFIPIFFTSPETRMLYRDLSLTITYALAVSLVFSLTILPALLRLLAGRNVGAYRSAVASRKKDPRLSRRFRILARPLFREHRFTTTLGIIALLLTPVIFLSLRKGYVDPLDTGSISATIDLAVGTHLEETREAVDTAVELIRKHPHVKSVSAKIEKSHADLTIRLKSGGADPESVIDELKKRTEALEAFVYYRQAGGENDTRELTLEFFGDDTDQLKDFATQMAGKLKSEIDEVKQVVLRFREKRRSLVVVPDRLHAARAGVSAAGIGQTLRQMLSGSIVTKFYDGEREVDVRLRAPPVPDRNLTPNELRAVRLPVAGTSLPLASLATFRLDSEETRVYRKNKRKSVSITARIGSGSVDAVATAVQRILDETRFPPDTVYEFGENLRRMREASRQMLFAVLASLLIVFIVLAALFESMSRPWLIIITVPLSLTALFVFFGAFNMSINMSVYIGLIMLGGLVVNNSILVVSTIGESEGVRATMRANAPRPERLIDPILRATTKRLRPILMTTCTTVPGMLPMAFDFSSGSGFFRPLALTVSVGMTAALAVSLLLVPFACYIFYRIKLKGAAV